MARAIGRAAEADRWTERADQIHRLILSRLYVSEEAAFYDLDAQDHFIKIRCDILSRICGVAVAFPGADDPLFVRPIPRNSWGAAQALTALRATRWFDHYGRSAEWTLRRIWGCSITLGASLG
jgi:hypothetical protein